MRSQKHARLAFVAIVLAACGPKQSSSGDPATAGDSHSQSRAAAMTVSELRTAMDEASRGERFSELGALASALETRGALGEAALMVLIDGLPADKLELFVAGATEGTLARKLGETRARAMDKHTASPTVDGDSLAILLPLSGPHAAIGAEFRAAIEVARKDAGVAVAFLDTKGTPEGARAAVEAAHKKHGAGAIIGPIGEIESRAAAARAAQLGIAIGLLSPEETGAAPEVGIFRLWHSRESAAAEAAEIAVELGYSAPAVLAPRDELGKSAAAAFVKAAKKAGASQVRAGFYDPSGSELEPDLKGFLGLIPLENERLRRHLRRYGKKRGWKSFSPDVDFDLLYIPDAYDRAALVASYLPFFNVELRAGDIVDTLGLRRKHGGRLPSVVQLLGSSEWHHPSLATRGGSAVDGALIAEPCVGGANEDYLDDNAAQLAARLRRAIGRSPSRLASQAYDGARLIFDRYRTSKRANKSLFVGAKAARGACGPSLIDAGGQLRRSSALLRVEGQELVLHEW